nr:hypothetical protein [uncultured Flavobacterium sp.]
MKRLSKPTLLLWLPVVVWAATFTVLTVLFFFGSTLEIAHGQALKTILLGILFINIIAMSVTCVAMTVYRLDYKEYLLRLLLMLSNIPAVIIYKLIYETLLIQ